MKKNLESGQSTVEFIFAFCFGVSVIFMTFNSALNYCTGYLIHYATFMASRVYLTSGTAGGTPQSGVGESMAGAVENATKTFNKYRLDIFKITTDKFQINTIESGQTTETYLTVGAKTTFDLRLDAIGKITGETTLEMVSESFLGHEPTKAHCAARTCHGITGNNSCTNTMDITLFDDGC